MHAQRASGDASQILYEFAVKDAQGRPLAEGRAVVVLNTPLAMEAIVMSLNGKRALITGASGALGAAIAQRLARDGATVLLHANSRPEAVEQLAAAITAAGGQAECHVFDLQTTRPRAPPASACWPAARCRSSSTTPACTTTRCCPACAPQQWHKVIDVSLNGFFRVTQPLLLPMLRTRWGRILNISSVASLTGNRGQVNYAAAKGALNSATKALSLEVAARGVTVNAIAPGIIASPMADGAFDKAMIDQLVPVQARRQAGGSGCARRLPGQRRGGLHHRADHLDQRRDDLSLASRPT